MVASLLALLVACASSGETVRGVTISTHGVGHDWASDAMVDTIKDVRSVGAGWIAIHPYAAIHADGSVGFDALDPANPPAWIARPIAEAHRLGMKILIKPHLAYWGSPFSWRGDIRFSSQAQWQRFFSTYQRWIVRVAQCAVGADGFVVGTELDATLDHADAWRSIIAAVRSATPAALTYAANWTDYQRVPFWDAVDVIGIQAYFPLSQGPDADASTIAKGWKQVMADVTRYARAQNRNVVFTELGYTRSFEAPLRPWEYRADDGGGATRVQATCMRTALLAIEAEPTVLGAFLWKWFPRPYSVGRDFQMASPQIAKVIQDVWVRGNASAD